MYEFPEHVQILVLRIANNPENWEKRQTALQDLQLLFTENSNPSSYTASIMSSLCMPLKSTISDLRSALVRDACQTVTILSQSCGENMKYLMRDFFTTIMDAVKVPNNITSGYVHEMMVFLLHQYSFKQQFGIITHEAMNSKSKRLREACAEYIGIMISVSESDFAALQTSPQGGDKRELWDLVERSFVTGLQDSSSEVRSKWKYGYSEILKLNSVIAVQARHRILDQLPRKLIQSLEGEAGDSDSLTMSQNSAIRNVSTPKIAKNDKKLAPKDSSRPRSATPRVPSTSSTSSISTKSTSSSIQDGIETSPQTPTHATTTTTKLKPGSNQGQGTSKIPSFSPSPSHASPVLSPFGQLVSDAISMPKRTNNNNSQSQIKENGGDGRVASILKLQPSSNAKIDVVRPLSANNTSKKTNVSYTLPNPHTSSSSIKPSMPVTPALVNDVDMTPEEELSDVKDCGYTVGRRVLLLPNKHNGTIHFVGFTHFATGIWIGVSLVEAVGKNDGSVKGVCYFLCEDGHGIFARPRMVHLLEEEEVVVGGGLVADDKAIDDKAVADIVPIQDKSSDSIENSIQENGNHSAAIAIIDSVIENHKFNSTTDGECENDDIRSDDSRIVEIAQRDRLYLANHARLLREYSGIMSSRFGSLSFDALMGIIKGRIAKEREMIDNFEFELCTHFSDKLTKQGL